MSSSYTEYCRNTITDALDSFEDQMIYGAELGYTLTEAMNVDGSCTYSRRLALDYIAEWFDEAAEYWEYEEYNFGEHRINPFGDPEGYMVGMVIAGVESILSQCATVDENWNNHIELTEEVIEKIEEEVAEVKEAKL